MSYRKKRTARYKRYSTAKRLTRKSGRTKHIKTRKGSAEVAYNNLGKRKKIKVALYKTRFGNTLVQTTTTFKPSSSSARRVLTSVSRAGVARSLKRKRSFRKF
jgi:hypothetical protein